MQVAVIAADVSAAIKLFAAPTPVNVTSSQLGAPSEGNASGRRLLQAAPTEQPTVSFTLAFPSAPSSASATSLQVHRTLPTILQAVSQSTFVSSQPPLTRGSKISDLGLKHAGMHGISTWTSPRPETCCTCHRAPRGVLIDSGKSAAGGCVGGVGSARQQQCTSADRLLAGSRGCWRGLLRLRAVPSQQPAVQHGVLLLSSSSCAHHVHRCMTLWTKM